jgi:DNA-binding beta-propeller fold protein YncE
MTMATGAYRTYLLASSVLALAVTTIALTARTSQQTNQEAAAAATADLRARLAAGPKVTGLTETTLAPTPPSEGWMMGMVSWVASDRDGLIYLLQRGTNADPIIVMDQKGKVVRSWGKGMYTMPHAIRIDPQGHVWTTDAASSKVYEFSREGKLMLEITVGGQPARCPNNFCSTTDIAFAPGGHLLISDGYSNARVVEYTTDGTKVREWGAPGTGPGQFRLPHSIQVDEKGVIYVADRENARVERFDREGNFLGAYTQYGKTFGLRLAGRTLWLATQPKNEPNLAPGWLIAINRDTGELQRSIDATGLHGMDVMTNGNLIFGPGPNASSPRWFR